MLSPLVTAASASAPLAPARSRSSRSKPEPTICSPGQAPGSRRKACRRRSMIATVWPSSARDMARPEPTRPQPTTITCTQTVQHGRPPIAKRRRRAKVAATSGPPVGCTLRPWILGPARPATPWRRPWRPRSLVEGAAGSGSAHRTFGPAPSSGAAAFGQGHAVPRGLPLSPEEQAARAGAHDRGAALGASQQDDGARRLVLRRHLVLGLRHRAGVDPAGQSDRRRRVLPHRADHDCRHRGAGLRHPLVPRSGQGLHKGGGCLCRRP